MDEIEPQLIFNTKEREIKTACVTKQRVIYLIVYRI